MNVEFHYYTVYFLALRAGFEDRDAQILAYSSQFVDHNIVSYRVQYGGGEYRIEPTQNYGFWNDSFPNDAYLPFHFFPGDTGDENSRRVDAGVNKFNTTPNSPGVKKLLVTGLETRNLYRVGIALHTYADSWAHQNFSGKMEPWNRIDPNSPIPPIGHAQALSKPDTLDLEWTDPRLYSPNDHVSNYRRFMQAARQIYKYLATYNRRKFDDLELVEWELTEIIGATKPRKSMSERIDDYIIKDSLTPYNRRTWLEDAVELPKELIDESMFRGYSKILWLKDELLYRSDILSKKPIAAKPGFDSSHLSLWHEAAMMHRKTAKRMINELTSG